MIRLTFRGPGCDYELCGNCIWLLKRIIFIFLPVDVKLSRKWLLMFHYHERLRCVIRMIVMWVIARPKIARICKFTERNIKRVSHDSGTEVSKENNLWKGFQILIFANRNCFSALTPSNRSCLVHWEQQNPQSVSLHLNWRFLLMEACRSRYFYIYIFLVVYKVH